MKIVLSCRLHTTHPLQIAAQKGYKYAQKMDYAVPYYFSFFLLLCLRKYSLTNSGDKNAGTKHTGRNLFCRIHLISGRHTCGVGRNENGKLDGQNRTAGTCLSGMAWNKTIYTHDIWKKNKTSLKTNNFCVNV